MDIYELEEHYLQKKLEGMDFTEIRKELDQKELSNEQIGVIIRSIDNKILSGLKSKTEKKQFNSTRILGILLLGGGLIVTIGTYSGWIYMGNYYIIAYGPVLTGAGMIFASNRKRTTKFNRKRKF